MTFTLSGFADEISPDLNQQLATLANESISHLELRSVWSTNVADLDIDAIVVVRETLKRAGVGVSAIGSPIGKIDIRAPLELELERMRKVATIATELDVELVRVFSFFIPKGESPSYYRQLVIDRMGALAEVAQEFGLILAHENEKDIYGDSPERCADLISSVASPALRATFDPANFVQCGYRPFSDAFPLLQPYISYVQIKDARADTGEVVLPGQGGGEIREILAALVEAGSEGYLSLEPHLRRTNRYGGFSGPDNFRRAAQALKDLLREISASWT